MPRKARTRRAASTLGSADPIRHVVLLMLENRSFDQALGSLQELFPKLEGVDPAAPNRNRTAGKVWYEQEPTTRRVMELDPKHETKNVLTQLAKGNRGFVIDFVDAYGKEATRDLIRGVMGYYERGRLPALQTLGEHFTVCDHWHASVPGPTWANRLFALSGTSLGRVKMPDLGKLEPNLRSYDQDTIFDRLEEGGVSWAVFHGDVPLSLLFENQRSVARLAHYHRFESFADVVAGPEADFPGFALIEPNYLGSTANDDHPPHDVLRGQNLIADVYNTLRRNPALWRSTLLVVLYDEHGGFYDHVEPPPAKPPDGHREEYTFDRLGVRVPALLVSPWVARAVSSTTFDHTSLLRYLIDKWGLGPLGRRTSSANSIAGLIARSGLPRTDYPDALVIGNPLPAKPGMKLTEHEEAAIALARSLEPVTSPPVTRRKPDEARYAARLAASRTTERRRRAPAPSGMPRGLRNKNPGNIRKGDPWLGLATAQPDPDFCTFASLAYGVRAIARILRSYAHRGVNTLRAVARNWAPRGDHNDPEAYARTLLGECRSLVKSIDAKIDLSRDALRFRVIRGIVVMENGREWAPRVSDAVIRKGMRLERD